MNQWLVVTAVVAVLVGAALGLFLGGQVAVNTPPAVYKTVELSAAFNAYRNAIYPIEQVSATVQTISAESWMSKFGSSALVITGRMLYKGRVMAYKTWRALTDGSAGNYPFLLEFDLNGDGIYSPGEAYVLTGDPVISAPIPLATYLKGGGK